MGQKPRILIAVTAALSAALVLAACASAGAGQPAARPAETNPPSPGFTPPVAPPETPPAAAGAKATPGTEPANPRQPDPAAAPPRGAEREFRTDFSRHSVPYDEILSGGPPKDGIPAIDEPQFVSVAEADEWLEDLEPVIFLQVKTDVRAYPLRILTWHEIVNDEVDGIPLVITFCPLCNTAIAFERTVAGQVLDFGTTGRLRYSNLIMYDRQTETWWQQATGEAIAGELTGTQLQFRSAQLIGWEQFKQRYPDGQVLSRETGFNRAYGQNPYIGYDDINRSPFLYDGPPTPEGLPPMARVLTVDTGSEAAAYPYRLLQELFVVNDQVGGQEIAVFWQPGAASALDAPTVAAGEDVGSAAGFDRRLGDRVLTFEYRDGTVRDLETGSAWNAFGEALEGPLAGEKLEPLVAINHFWFSWAAFRPDTRVYTAGGQSDP